MTRIVAWGIRPPGSLRGWGHGRASGRPEDDPRLSGQQTAALAPSPSRGGLGGDGVRLVVCRRSGSLAAHHPHPGPPLEGEGASGPGGTAQAADATLPLVHTPCATTQPPVTPGHSMKKRIKRLFVWGLFSLTLLVGSGILLADRLMPPATGAPGMVLPVVPGQTALDRELEPLLARHPGKTAALLVPDGLDAFASRAISARQAGRSLDLQYYIWHDDLTGHLLMYEAWKAAERGVRVRMLLDDINTSGKDASLLALDSHDNIEIRAYNPFRNGDGVARVIEMIQRMFSITYRMHNKAWIADNQVAIVGGRNIGIEYFDAHNQTNFRDLDVLLFGPAVSQASAIFDDFWNSDAVVPIAQLNRKPRQKLESVLAGIKEEANGKVARRYLDRVDMSPNVRAYLAEELSPHWSDRIRVLSDPPLKWKDNQPGEY